MASLTIRNLDERVKQNMRKSAADHGVSMEQEARLTLIEKFGDKPVKPKMTAEELMAWVDALPMGKPVNPLYETLDHKTLTDMMWDGEL